MIHFLNPVFFYALISVAMLLMIYLLFRRLKSIKVPTMMFWREGLKSRKSGYSIKYLPLPLTFFVEMLILIFLVLAAAVPLIARMSAVPEAIFILDNSFSMRAGRSLSTKQKAINKISSILAEFPNRKNHIFLAGNSIDNLGAHKDIGKFQYALKNWHCDNSKALLYKAISLAKKIKQTNATIYIFTDHMPNTKTFDSGIEWYALGTPYPNTAIVNAVRERRNSTDTCLLMIANQNNKIKRNTIKISLNDGKSKPIIQPITLPPLKLEKISLNLPDAVGNLSIELLDDNLEFDNKVFLLPEKEPMLRCMMNVKDKSLAKLISKVMLSSGKVRITENAPELLITDSEKENSTIPHQLIITGLKTTSYKAPFTLNRSNSLLDGTNFKSVIWCADNTISLPGEPIVMTRKNVLFSQKTTEKQNLYYLNLIAKYSTLQRTPNFPILFWNLTDRIIAQRDGLRRKNYRSGDKVSLKFPKQTQKLLLVSPNGDKAELSTAINPLVINVIVPGRYKITADKKDYIFQVNPLSFDESDLLASQTGTIKGKQLYADILRNYYNISWIFLISALALLGLHAFLIRRVSQ